ncbi:APC family permease [Amycolatopsis sp. H20-H5]|uniref:APC family permease n=1 Tax=Amycolatopsis sp. H20-H5 TaxID=3046309 RepID=UPI002DBD98BC|nr:APC family permease [Amycolatopsis sp. H20-H5]MEC3982667.1 APC family permease [Amycolatopsis sp. H20-H5]
MGTHTPGRPRGLGQRRLGAAQIVFFVVAAAGPLYAIAGGVSTTYAVTGSIGVPLSFVLLAPVLALFAVGYAAMSRYITNAGAFYPYVANGIGRSAGTAVSFVTLIAYNAIQISIYGLFGWSLSNWLLTLFGLTVPWWLCAIVMVLIIGALGVLRIDINAKVLGIAMCLEIAIIVIIDVALFAHPAGGSVSFAPLAPGNLFTAGVGAVFAFSVAVFTGFEGAATYGEECRDPARTVGRATFIAIGLTAVLYVVSSLAMAVAIGPDAIVGASQADGPGLLFGLAGTNVGEVFSDTAYVLFMTSQIAALLSFHNSVARYFFALGREGTLPAALGRTSRRTGAPVAGSLVQTGLGLVLVIAFAATGSDPITQLFTWLGTTASTGVVIIMIAVSLSVIGFFRRRQRTENAWRRWIAPVLAAVLLSAVLVMILINFDLLLGPEGTPLLRWGLPGLLVAGGLAGFLRAELLRTRDPEVYAGIGGSPVEDGNGDDDDARRPIGSRER